MPLQIHQVVSVDSKISIFSFLKPIFDTARYQTRWDSKWSSEWNWKPGWPSLVCFSLSKGLIWKETWTLTIQMTISSLKSYCIDNLDLLSRRCPPLRTKGASASPLRAQSFCADQRNYLHWRTTLQTSALKNHFEWSARQLWAKQPHHHSPFWPRGNPSHAWPEDTLGSRVERKDQDREKSLQKRGAAGRACKSVAQQGEPAKAWRSRKSLQKCGAAGRACKSVAPQEEPAKACCRHSTRA